MSVSKALCIKNNVKNLYQFDRVEFFYYLCGENFT